MKTASDIINTLGGTVAVARALELTPSVVSSWKTSGSIPKWRRAGLAAIAAEKNITIEGLQA